MSSSNRMSGPCQLLPPLIYPPPWTKKRTDSFSVGFKSASNTQDKKNVSNGHILNLLLMLLNSAHLVCIHLKTSSLLIRRIRINWMWFVNILRRIRWHFEHQTTARLAVVPENGFKFLPFHSKNFYTFVHLLSFEWTKQKENTNS